MPSPIESMYFVHTAIVAELNDIESAARAAEGPAALGGLRGRVDQFARLMDKHTRGEEVGIFPRLSQDMPHIADTYLHDHEEERAAFAELIGLLGRCAEGDARSVDPARRVATAIAVATSAHIRKENKLVIPLIAQRYPAPEQGSMMQGVVSVFTPEEMAAAVPFIVRNNPLDAAAAYVGILAGMMPPPAFAAARGWIRAGVPADRFAALVERVPALAG